MDRSLGIFGYFIPLLVINIVKFPGKWITRGEGSPRSILERSTRPLRKLSRLDNGDFMRWSRRGVQGEWQTLTVCHSQELNRNSASSTLSLETPSSNPATERESAAPDQNPWTYAATSTTACASSGEG